MIKKISLVLSSFLVCSICHAQDSTSQLSSAITDIEKRLTSSSVSSDLQQQCSNELAQARSSLKRGYVYLSLYTIRSCQLELGSLDYAASLAGIHNAESLETEWKKLGAVLIGKEKLVADQASKERPAVVTAIANSSQIQVKQYYQSGRLFALNSNIAEGAYYLGRAPANLDFAIFCNNLHFPKFKAPLELRSLQPELAKLENMALRTYKSADVSSQQGQFNRLNANLKVAGELDHASMFPGAMLKYLESELYFGLLITPAENEDLEHLRARTKEIGRMIMSEKTDHSIGLLFWQMADVALNPTNAAQPDQAQIKRAVVILNRVLPNYFDYLKEKR